MKNINKIKSIIVLGLVVLFFIIFFIVGSNKITPNQRDLIKENETMIKIITNYKIKDQLVTEMIINSDMIIKNQDNMIKEYEEILKQTQEALDKCKGI